MSFELLDSLSLPGDPEKPNEDSFVYRTKLAAVFDGATPLSESLLPGPSDAQWIARFGANRLAGYASAGEGTPRDWLRGAASDAEKSFTALRLRAPKAQHENPLASMMTVALEGAQLTALWFGDCTLIVKSREGVVRLVGDAMKKRDAERARVKKIADMAKRGPAAAGVRAEFLPNLRAARDTVNSARGAWLFGPHAECAEHARGEELMVAPGDLLLLATDGILTLVNDYDRYDPEALIAAVEARGLKALGEEIRAIEAEDPEGNIYPRFKKSDDATALLLRIAG